MKNLPLLPSDFPYFDWENSTGNATQEQLTNSYTAITSNGYTKNFSKIVWNDLVDLLYRAITESGMSWDSSYGSYKETKMLEKNGALTSVRFNAVTVNIEQILKNQWRWHLDSTKQGYLGRPRVFGIAEKRFLADHVYGWYMIEIYRVLNVLIAVLKNEANFGELVTQSKIETVSDTLLKARKSALMVTEALIKAYSNTNLLGRPSYPLIANVLVETKNSGILSPLEPFGIVAIDSSKTYTEALFERIRPRYGIARNEIYSDGKGILNVPNAERLNVSTAINTFVDAYISFSGKVDMYFEEVITTNERAELLQRQATGLFHEDEFKTHYSAAIDKKELTRLDSNNAHYSRYGIDLSKVLSKNMGDTDTQSMSYYVGGMKVLEALYAEHESAMAFDDESSMNMVLPELLDHESNVFFHDTSGVNITLPRYISYAKAHYFVNAGDMKSLPSIRVALKDKFLSDYVASLARKGSSKLNAKTKSFTKSLAELDFYGIENYWAIKRGTDLYIKRVWFSRFDDDRLYIDTNPFIDPIQRDTDLYIQQSHFAWQYNDELNIDRECFLEPVKRGTDLYIRQVESIKGGNESA